MFFLSNLIFEAHYFQFELEDAKNRQFQEQNKKSPDRVFVIETGFSIEAGHRRRMTWCPSTDWPAGNSNSHELHIQPFDSK